MRAPARPRCANTFRAATTIRRTVANCRPSRRMRLPIGESSQCRTRSCWDLDFALDLAILDRKRCKRNGGQRQGGSAAWSSAAGRKGHRHLPGGGVSGAKCPISFRWLPRIWHNHAEEGHQNMPVHSGKSKRSWAACIVNGIGLAALAAVIVMVPAARAQNAGQNQGKGEASPPGNSENGKKIFTKDGCYECHGREGQGAAQGAGPRIGPLQLSFEAFTKYVHQPTGQMPPYTSKVISDQELADIYAYLQSRPKAA